MVNLEAGLYPAAEALAREALEGDQETRPEAWQRSFAEGVLGASLAGQKQYAPAQPLLLQGARGLGAHAQVMSAPERFRLERVRGWLAALYRSRGQPAQAAIWSPPLLDARE
jgi:hypothetical protein